ncbi:MAG: hypothetical protein DCC68_25530 [Planctomycetota bacterium]|nr:MAG: hypothetical protein DCC68_25530 [Planctomycetota bacterium]
MLAYAPYDGPINDPPPPPANTPIGSFGANCAASFFEPPPDSPTSFGVGAPAAAPPAPAGAPPLEIFVTVTVDEDDGDRSAGDISLREAILMANAGNADATIHLPAGTYTLVRPGRGEDTGGIGDLDIANPGHTTRILGAGLETTLVRNGVDDRLFHIHAGSTVELRGMSIEQGIEPTGGGILNAGDLTIVESRVRFNFGQTTGGGIANAAGATLAVNQSTIANNSSQYGGGIANQITGFVSITGSMIESNFAFSGGGMLNHGGTVQVSASTIRLNNASESGGGLVNLSITAPATATLTSNSITGNQVTTSGISSALAQGGGICNAAVGGTARATVAMVGGSLTNNRATAGDLEQAIDSAAQGGGIFNRAAGGNATALVTADGVNVTTNVAAATATLSAEASGGGVYNRAESGQATATFTTNNGSVSGNSATTLVFGGEGAIDPKSIARGGAIFNRARMDNTVATAMAGATNINSNSVVANAVDSADVAAEGGAIYNEAGISPASAPTAIATVSLSGGGLRFNTTDANDGVETKSRGGAIATIGDYGHSVVDLSGTVVEGNRATAESSSVPSVEGGGIYNRVSPLSGLSRLAIDRTTIRDNRLDLVGAGNPLPRGGGLFTDGANVSVRDSTLSGNKTGPRGEGGAIFARKSLNVVNSTVSGNEAHSGGGIYGQSGATLLANSTVAMNSVTLNGGGVYAAATAAVTLRNTIVAKNLLTFEDVSPSPNDLAGAYVATSVYNWIGSGTGSTGIVDGVEGNRVGSVGTPLEPFLGPLASNGGTTQTHLPFPISPLIDAGEPGFNPNNVSPALLWDQRLETRVMDGNRDSIGRIDIGAVEARSTLFADLDGDGRVGLRDLMVIQRHWNAAGATYADGDLNGDSVVDRFDAALLIENYASVFAPASPAAPQAVVARAHGDALPIESPTTRTRAIRRREMGAHVVRAATAADLSPVAVDRVWESHGGASQTLRALRRRR